MSIGTKRNWSLVGVLALLAVLLLSLGAAATPTQAQDEPERCFAETGICVSGRVLEYWEQNGGLPVFGLPITEQREETIGDWTGQVQWFERNRLELHPENEPPFDVLLGRLGDAFVERSGGSPPRQEPAEGCFYFEQTGYNVCGDFEEYWAGNGLDLDGQLGSTPEESLALFGFPLTGEFEATLEDGNTYTVQWFERARFERHPQNAPPFNVLLSRLGVDELQSRGEEIQTQPPPQGDATLTIAFVGNRGGNMLGFNVTIVDEAGVERTAITVGETIDEGRVTFGGLPGNGVRLTNFERDGRVYKLRILPTQDVNSLILPLTSSGEKTIRLIVSIDPPIVLADPDDGIRAGD